MSGENVQYRTKRYNQQRPATVKTVQAQEARVRWCKERGPAEWQCGV